MSRKYTYKGAVYAFDNLVAAHWEASTWAISEAKAVSNLKYRFRKTAGDGKPHTDYLLWKINGVVRSLLCFDIERTRANGENIC